MMQPEDGIESCDRRAPHVAVAANEYVIIAVYCFDRAVPRGFLFL